MKKFKSFSRSKRIILGVTTLVLIFALALSIGALATAAPGEVVVNKTAVLDGNGTYDVSINVTGTPFTTETDAGRYDVVLAVDISTSMRDTMKADSSMTKIASAKAAAVSFVNTVLGPNANANNRVALVTFGTDGTQVRDFTGKADKQLLINAINNLSAGNNSYTNIQEGLILARDYIHHDANASANKIVVILSDGEPTRSVIDLYWKDSSSNAYLDETQMDETWYPSNYNNDGMDASIVDRYKDRIIVEANKIRALGASIYSVGIDASVAMGSVLGNDASYHFSRNGGVAAWQTDSGSNLRTWSVPWPYNTVATKTGGPSGGSYVPDYLIPGFNDFKVAYAAGYYTATTSSQLNTIFQNLINEFKNVATGGVLTDTLPEYFDLDLASLPAGATYNAATKTITWTVGSINDVTKTLTYKVIPVPGYWGEGYTNATTNLAATSVDGNPKYTPASGDQDVDIDVLSPVRYDDGAVASKYAGVNDTVNNVNRNSAVNITAATVKGNDTVTSLKYVSRTDNGGVYDPLQNVWIKTVPAQPYLSSGASYGTVVQNPDGSFTYTYDLATYGYDKTKTTDTFYYYLADSTNTAATRSEPIMVTVNLVDLVDVTVQYLNNAGGAQIVGDETLVRQIGDSVLYADVEKDLLASNGFLYNHGVPELSGGASYTVVSGSNVLKLYYDNATGRTVNVYFKDKATEATIAIMQTLSGTFGNGYTIPQPTIAGYTYDSTVNPNGTAVFKMTNADITVYYNAKTLNSTVHYVDVTGLTANGDGSYTGGSAISGQPDDHKSGKINTSFTVATPTINGYNYVGTFGSNVFTDPEHDVYVYYTKKTELPVTIKYILKGSDPEELIGDQVPNPVVKYGTFGDAYTVDTPATIGGYAYDSMNDPNGGVFKDPCDTVKVYYTKQRASVEVIYKEYGNPSNILGNATLSGLYQDPKTVNTDDITGTDGYLYTYHSIDNPYHPGYTSVTLTMGMTNPIIVYMEKVAAEDITVHFLELNTTTPPLTGDGTLSGYVGEDYTGQLQDYIDDTDIDGFTYHSTADPNDNGGKFAESNSDITLYYTRLATTITVLHKYTDSLLFFGATDERDGFYKGVTSIGPLDPGDGYAFVGYSVDTAEGDSLTAYDGSEIDAEFGTADYTVTLLYAPTEGTVNVHYLEVGSDIGDAALSDMHVYNGDYAYDVISVDPETGEETVTTIPADKFYRSDIAKPAVTGHHLTGSITLGVSDEMGSSVDFTEASQDIVVWYAKDEVTLPVKYIDTFGNIIHEPDSSITGLYNEDYTEDALDEVIDISGYQFDQIKTPLFNGGLYPTVAGADSADAVVYLVYHKVRVSLPIEYRDYDTDEEIGSDLTSSITGYVNAAYDLPGYPAIAGYTPHSIDDPNLGVYPAAGQEQTITYYYTKTPASVLVRYVESVGDGYENIAASETLSGHVGDPYSVDIKDIPGYSWSDTLNSNDDENNLTEDMSTIYVVYTRNTYDALVKFVESGNEEHLLIDSVPTIHGPYEDLYSDHMPDIPVIPGWHRVGDIDYPDDGSFGPSDGTPVILVPYARDNVDMSLRYRLLGSGPSVADIQEPYDFSGSFGDPFTLDNDEGLFDIFGYTIVDPEDKTISGDYAYDDPQTEQDESTVFAYYQKNFYSYPVEYRATNSGKLLYEGSVVVSGYYLDSYSVDRKSFTGYRYVRTDDPFGGVFSEINDQEQVITVWYSKKGGGGGGGGDDDDTTVPEEPTPTNPPVIEPVEPVVEVPEEEVPAAPVPNTGGSETYLIPLLGLALIIAGGVKLISSQR